MKSTTHRRRATRWTLASPAASGHSGIRSQLVPRTIYFPSNWLAQIESQGPGALIEVMTLAISEFTTKGGA